MRSALFDQQNQERQTEERWALQSSKMLRCRLVPGAPEIVAAQGAMVAYQGNMDFSYQGSGGGMKMLKKFATGQGGNLMKVRGQGEVFLAREAQDIFLITLEGEALTLNSASMLAYDDSLRSRHSFPRRRRSHVGRSLQLLPGRPRHDRRHKRWSSHAP